MKIGIPCEVHAGETRVALTPNLVPLLCKDGHEMLVETSAGARAHFTDAQYAKACATILPDAQSLYAQSEAVFKVLPPEMNIQLQSHETDLMRAEVVCIGWLGGALPAMPWNLSRASRTPRGWTR
jgi:NAD(P) transhydrogenase subunit alpha